MATRIREVMTPNPRVLDAGSTVQDAAQLGDLAQDRDPESALAEVSAAPPNR